MLLSMTACLTPSQTPEVCDSLTPLSIACCAQSLPLCVPLSLRAIRKLTLRQLAVEGDEFFNGLGTCDQLTHLVCVR